MSAFEFKAFATFYDPDTDYNIEVCTGIAYADHGFEACRHAVDIAERWLKRSEHNESWQLQSVRNEPTGN